MSCAQSAKAVWPPQGALDDPPPSAEPVARLDAIARFELQCPVCATKPDGLSKHTLDRHAADLGVLGHGLLILSLPDALYRRDKETEKFTNTRWLTSSGWPDSAKVRASGVGALGGTHSADRGRGSW